MNERAIVERMSGLWLHGPTRTVSGSVAYHKVRFLCLLCILSGLVLTACQPIQPESRWAEAQRTSESQEIVSEGDVIPGGEFNKFFPDPDEPFDITFLQEKEGFAEAALEFEGEEVATLAVSDTANNPSARDKFAQSDDEIEGYPLAAVGNNGSAILVADRIQVQVRSKASDFAVEDREEWLLEFNLDGLAALAE